VSSLAPTTTGAVDLVTNRRLITTSVLVKDGTMLVLGGLTSDEVKESVSKVPALGDIPVLGNLFRYRSASKTRRNLIVFLKPTILHDASMESAISNEKYNYMRAQQLEAREVEENLLPKQDQPVLPAEQPPATGHDEPPPR
jgi:general secretion pathway protein D